MRDMSFAGEGAESPDSEDQALPDDAAVLDENGLVVEKPLEYKASLAVSCESPLQHIALHIKDLILFNLLERDQQDILEMHVEIMVIRGAGSREALKQYFACQRLQK